MLLPLREKLKVPRLEAGGSRLHLSLIIVVAFLAVTAILSLKLLPLDLPNVTVSKPSPEDFAAPRNLEFVNEQATKEARERAAEEVATVYLLNNRVLTDVEQSLRETFGLIRRMQLAQAGGNDQEVATLAKKLPLPISTPSLQVLVEDAPTNLNLLQNITQRAVYTVMKGKIPDYGLADARKKVGPLIRNPIVSEDGGLKRVRLPAPVAKALTEIAENSLQANFVPNFEATTKAKQERMQHAGPVKTLITRGQMIVRKGDMVTQEHVAILDALGLHKRPLNLGALMANALFVCLAIFVVGIYLAQQDSPLLSQPRLMWLLVLLVVAALAMSRGGIQVSNFFTPVACASMLIAIMLDYRLSLLVTALMAVAIGIITSDIGPCTVVMITGLVAVLSVSSVTRRGDMVIASLVVWVVNVLAVLVVSLWNGEDLSTMGRNTLIFGTLNGLTASVVAVGALPFLENLFTVTTNIKLLDYSNPAEPLLQRLMTDAPGTYQHSILVANLAEAAARAIGGDALLAKVGAFYHDIGKMKAANYFVENQLGQENPHDRLTPSLSAHIIISHVHDGMELARSHRLPQVIADFIDMHHGDRLVSYFYHKALQKGEQATETDFRYDGRRPNTRETAIVMMADTIEAKARLLAKPDQENLDKMVRESIKLIMEDGQLDASPLSLRDLHVIAGAFVKTLMGIYHSRIEYPSRDLPGGGEGKPAEVPSPLMT